MSKRSIDERTIADFGTQWLRFQVDHDYYGSKDCLADIFGPLVAIDEVAGKRVGDIGSGSGRIVAMLLESGARHVIAVEPSRAFEVLLRRFGESSDRVDLVRGRGEEIASYKGLDLVTSIGVLHHIVDPNPVIRAAYEALKPGGRMVIWVYAQEGNRLYLALFGPLRKITQRLPDRVLYVLSSVLNVGVDIYLQLCRWLSLPMRRYFLDHLGRLTRDQRRMTVYDQLNPAHAKYYPADQARALLAANGFTAVETYYRHGYSWTVSGIKPQD
ncbi:MAG: class I SAM-dependent methyltransferase [Acidobacteriota bacterium]